MRKPPFVPGIGADDFNSVEWQRRYRDDAFPQHRIRLETENHYSYINLQIQNHTQIRSFLDDLVRELEEVTANRVMRIDEINENGLMKTIYTAVDRETLPADANLRVAVRVFVNYRDRVSILTPSSSDKIIEQLIALLKSRFFDTLGYPISKTAYETILSNEACNWQLKRRQHQLYATPHTESKESPIETLLQDALVSVGVEFAAQEKIFVEGQLFTIPDFLIKEPLLAIYCDGTEFHMDAEKIIKDKQQDRILQRMGYRVFRFSGSEIMANARKCAEEIRQFVQMLS